jgi:hypothetical protein
MGDIEVKSPRIPNLGRRLMASRFNIVVRRIIPKPWKVVTNKVQPYKSSRFTWLTPRAEPAVQIRSKQDGARTGINVVREKKSSFFRTSSLKLSIWLYSPLLGLGRFSVS